MHAAIGVRDADGLDAAGQPGRCGRCLSVAPYISIRWRAATDRDRSLTVFNPTKGVLQVFYCTFNGVGRCDAEANRSFASAVVSHRQSIVAGRQVCKRGCPLAAAPKIGIGHGAAGHACGGRSTRNITASRLYELKADLWQLYILSIPEFISAHVY